MPIIEQHFLWVYVRRELYPFWKVEAWFIKNSLKGLNNVLATPTYPHDSEVTIGQNEDYYPYRMTFTAQMLSLIETLEHLEHHLSEKMNYLSLSFRLDIPLQGKSMQFS